MRITLLPEKDSWFRRNTTLVLCVLTMLLLTLGISEQGATIAQQKNLIQVLSQDSQALMAMRAQQAVEAQRKSADPQVAPNTKDGATQEQPADAQEKQQKSEESAAAQQRQHRAPKADAVVDLREAGRVLLKS